MTNYDQLRSLTTNYCRLQGLRFMPVWLFFLFGPWLNGLPDHRPTFVRDNFRIGALLFCAFWIWLAGRYYRKRYGAVQSKPPRPSQILFLIAAVAAYLVCYLADEKNPPIGFAAAWWGCFIGLQAVRGATTRVQRIAYSVAGVSMLALALFPLTGKITAHQLLSVDRPSGALWLGTVMIILGLIDHFQLVRLMSSSRNAHA